MAPLELVVALTLVLVLVVVDGFTRTGTTEVTGNIVNGKCETLLPLEIQKNPEKNLFELKFFQRKGMLFSPFFRRNFYC